MLKDRCETYGGEVGSMEFDIGTASIEVMLLYETYRIKRN